MAIIEAVFQGGVFKPLSEVHLTENQRVLLNVQSSAQQDAEAWLAEAREFQQELIAKYGVLPDSTMDIAEDRMR